MQKFCCIHDIDKHLIYSNKNSSWYSFEMNHNTRFPSHAFACTTILFSFINLFIVIAVDNWDSVADNKVPTLNCKPTLDTLLPRQQWPRVVRSDEEIYKLKFLHALVVFTDTTLNWQRKRNRVIALSAQWWLISLIRHLLLPLLQVLLQYSLLGNQNKSNNKTMRQSSNT